MIEALIIRIKKVLYTYYIRCKNAKPCNMYEYEHGKNAKCNSYC